MQSESLSRKEAKDLLFPAWIVLDHALVTGWVGLTAALELLFEAGPGGPHPDQTGHAYGHC